jgi:pimeloyl-ACP methyl ester carboxylesterase
MLNSRRFAILAMASLVGAVGLQFGSAPSVEARRRTSTSRLRPRPVAPPVTAAPLATLPGATPPAPTGRSTVAWVACGGQFECATVTVPIDYNLPNGAKIGIGLKRVKATNPAATKSILINPGGPSGSGIGFLEAFPALFTPAVRAEFSVIGFDPRGIGKSAALPCGSTRDRSARTGKEYIAAIKDACFNRAPDLVRSITTANTARDLDSIRAALGEDKLNYYGASYGTYLGLVYADLFPTRVGRFVIDSAVDPRLRAIELTALQYSAYEATLVDFMNRCAANRACNFSMARYDKLLLQVEARPVEFGQYAVGRGGLESITLGLIRRRQEQLLSRVLNEFENKNGSSIPEIVVLFDNALPDVNDLTNDPDGDAMYFQVACAEGFHPSASLDSPNAKLNLIYRVAPHFLYTSTSAAGSQVCAFWGQQIDTRPIPQPKPGVPGMMFVGARGDSVTPISGTRRVAAEWLGSVLVEVPTSGHAPLPDSACLNAAAGPFFLTGQLPSPAACPGG